MSETHPPVSFPGFVDAGGSGHVLQGFLRLLLRRLQGLQHKTDAATDCRLVEHSVSMYKSCSWFSKRLWGTLDSNRVTSDLRLPFSEGA